MTVKSLEKRIAAMEVEVQALKRQLSNRAPDRPSTRSWLDDAGRFKDDPVFDEIVRLGREYRESQRPVTKKRKKATKRAKHVRA